MKPPLSPSQHFAFPTAAAPVHEGILLLLVALPSWSEPGRCSSPASSILSLLLPGFLTPLLLRAPAASASPQCSSFVHLVFVQRCSWKRLRQPAGTGASLVHPLLLCSPGSASVPCSPPASLSQQLVLPTATLRNSRGLLLSPVGPRERRDQSKPRQAPQSLPGGAGALLPRALLFDFLFPNQKWPKKRW